MGPIRGPKVGHRWVNAGICGSFGSFGRNLGDIWGPKGKFTAKEVDGR